VRPQRDHPWHKMDRRYADIACILLIAEPVGGVKIIFTDYICRISFVDGLVVLHCILGSNLGGVEPDKGSSGEKKRGV
jgi:hypothetical protein